MNQLFEVSIVWAILKIILDAESGQISVASGSMPTEEVLLRFQQRWECDYLPVFGVGVLVLLCSVFLSHKPQL